MDGNEVRAILSRYGSEAARIRPLIEKYQYLRNRLESPGIVDYERPRRRGSGEAQEKTAALLDQLEKAQAAIEEQQAEALIALAETLDLIGVLPNSCKSKRALELRYIDLMEDSEAVGALGVSERTLYRLISAGLDEVARAATGRGEQRGTSDDDESKT